MTDTLDIKAEEALESTCAWRGCKAPWPTAPTVGWTLINARYVLDTMASDVGLVDVTIYFCPEHSRAFLGLTDLVVPEITRF